VAHIAEVLGYKKDKKDLLEQAERVRTGINKYLYDPEKAEYIGDIPYDEYVPVLNVCALNYGIVPEADIQRVEDRLIRNIVEEKDNHLFGGIFAIHSAYEYLPWNGYAALAYDLIREPTWPSFGWMVGEGATTLWEGFNRKNSDMHHFLGAVDNYFYRHLAGINFDASEPGFKKIVFRPGFPGGLEHANASYESLRGEIRAGWKKLEPGLYEYNVTIPANCTSEFIYPEGAADVTLNGKNIYSGGKNKSHKLTPGEHRIEIQLNN